MPRRRRCIRDYLQRMGVGGRRFFDGLTADSPDADIAPPAATSRCSASSRRDCRVLRSGHSVDEAELLRPLGVEDGAFSPARQRLVCRPARAGRHRRHDHSADDLELGDFGPQTLRRTLDPLLARTQRDHGIRRERARVPHARTTAAVPVADQAASVQACPHRPDDVEHRQDVGQRPAVAVDQQLDVVTGLAVERHQLGADLGSRLSASIGPVSRMRRRARQLFDGVAARGRSTMGTMTGPSRRGIGRAGGYG